MTTVALTGNSATGETGRASAVVAAALVGLTVSGRFGSIRIVAPEDLTVSLTGVSAAGSIGMPTPVVYQPVQIPPPPICYPFEGVPATPVRRYWGAYGTPFTSVPAPAGGLVAASPGVIFGRFGWADFAAGTVQNIRTTGEQQQGLIMPPTRIDWSRVFWAAGRYYIRAGLPVTLLSEGNFYARFASGAYAGDPVYASLIDGSALSGQTTNAEATPFYVVRGGAPGELAVISSSAKFGV